MDAQVVNIGIPPIWNFAKKMYKAGTQNWDAAQDSRGVMYWANNEGLLRYDGNRWKCLPVANSTVVRSIGIDTAGRIFVGAQNEFGYFSPSANGALVYHSMVDLLPSNQQNFEDVWDIVFWGNDVFFRTNKLVFQYSGANIKIHDVGEGLTSMFATPKGVILQKDLTNLLLFQHGTFQSAFNIAEIRSELTGVIPWSGDTLLFSSLKNGLFYLSGTQFGHWITNNDALLKEARIYAGCLLPNKQIALGTSLAGLIVLDDHRRIFRHLIKKSGLQSNNVLSTLADKSGNVWLGLDNGIDCVVLDAPFTNLFPDNDLQETGYAAAVFQNNLYLGVSNGVYVAPWQPFYKPENNNHFQKVKGTDGQVWSMNTIGNQLVLGHHEGAFALNGQQANNISSERGAWTFVQVSEEYMLGGTYNGLTLYQKIGGNWKFLQKITGLSASCRKMVKDIDGAIWISHPYQGLYRVTWSPIQKDKVNVQFYNSKNGLPSDLNNYVYQIAGKAVFATSKGIYRFNSISNRFTSDIDFNRLLGTDRRVKYLHEDNWGKIWYLADNEVGVLHVDDLGLKKEVKKQTFPELANKLVGGFEFIYTIDQNNVIFGVEQGFLHYNMAAPPRDTNLQVVLSQVIARGYDHRDTTLFEGWFTDETGRIQPKQTNKVSINANLNDIRFVFTATDYKDPSQLEYRVRLKGLNSIWSDWSTETQRDYINLSPGTYTFEVQARLQDSHLSNIISYTFTIRPPWYASTPALLIYLALFAGMITHLFKKQKQKFETEKATLTQSHQLKEAEHLRQVAQSKAKLNEIQTEKLEAEIEFKNQELASATMHLVQKGEILLTVQDALRNILDKQTNPSVRKEIQHLLNLLSFDKQLDDDWEQFAFHFDKVHVDFLQRLRTTLPQLSVNDHKLCAYLRMNLSTKEIAPLMNISVRGVEASRYRLRKKLELSNDANLTDFLLNI